MTRTQPAILITGTVDPSPTGDITDLLAIKDGDGTLQLTIYGEPYPVIFLDAEDIAALTNLLTPRAEPMNTRDACTQALELLDNIDDLLESIFQALELLDNIDDLLESIFPTPEYHNQGQKAEAKLSAARGLIYNRLTTIEDNIAAQSPITAPSADNATLPEQEDAPS